VKTKKKRPAAATKPRKRPAPKRKPRAAVPPRGSTAANAKTKKKRPAAATKPRKRPAPKRKPRAAVPPRAAAAANVRRVEAAVRKFDRAQQAAAERGADLLAVAVTLGEAAVEKCMVKLAGQLAERELLRDALALKDAFAAASPGSLPADLERLRLLPDALIQWLADSLGLLPSEQQGEMEVPAGKLTGFACDFQPPEDADQLVRVRVTCRGWKQNGRSLIPPRVGLCGKNGAP